MIAGLIVILIVMGWLAARVPAQAGVNHQGLPVGLGHPPNHTEYFDGDCCNQNDCEMVPDAAVQETKDGWKIRYWTEKYGGLMVLGFVARGQERASKKCTEDGNCIGVCAYPHTKTTSRGAGTFGTEVPDYTKPAFVRCLYVMPLT